MGKRSCMRNNDRFEMQKPKFESEQEKVVRNINSFPTTFFRCYSQNLLADRLCQPAHANLTSQFSNLSFFTVTKKAVTISHHCFQPGDPREIRTPDTLIRSQVLYPAELLGHMAGVEGLKPPTYGFGDRCSINCAIPLSVITTIK